MTGNDIYRATTTTLLICAVVTLFVLKIGVKTRMIIPMLYWLAFQTIWSEFQTSHIMLAHGIGCAMLVIVLLSWIAAFVYVIHRSHPHK